MFIFDLFYFDALTDSREEEWGEAAMGKSGGLLRLTEDGNRGGEVIEEVRQPGFWRREGLVRGSG